MLTWGIGENGQLGRISISLRHPKAFEGEALLVARRGQAVVLLAQAWHAAGSS